MRIYNLRFRKNSHEVWSYLNAAGSPKEIFSDMVALKKMGFKEIQYGHFEINFKGMEVVKCIKNLK